VCTDRPGLLARAAAVLRAHRIRLHDARIATFGERVEDFFMISDEGNHAIADAGRLKALQSALIEALTDSTDKDSPNAQQRASA
jgi:[protein-PII] uridylyltransferase